jgi:hypothetical protein
LLKKVKRTLFRNPDCLHGFFRLTRLSAQQHTREIGICKVLWATFSNIAQMLS